MKHNTNAQSEGLRSLVAQRTHCSSHKTANAQSWDAGMLKDKPAHNSNNLPPLLLLLTIKCKHYLMPSDPPH